MIAATWLDFFTIDEVVAFEPNGQALCRLRWPDGDLVNGTYRVSMASTWLHPYGGLGEMLKQWSLKWTDCEPDDPSVNFEYSGQSTVGKDGEVWHLFNDLSPFRWSGWVRLGMDGNLLVDLNDNMTGV